MVLQFHAINSISFFLSYFFFSFLFLSIIVYVYKIRVQVQTSLLYIFLIFSATAGPIYTREGLLSNVSSVQSGEKVKKKKSFSMDLFQYI